MPRTCSSCLRFQPFGVEDKGKCVLRDSEVNARDSCEDYAKEVEVKHNSEGWIFICGRQTQGPFKYLDQADHDELGKAFGIPSKEVWKAKIHVYGSETETKRLESPDIIELENKTIQPLFDGIFKKIHPAIGVDGDRAYVSVFIPCIVQEQKKDGPTEATEQELPFFITSLKERLPLDKKVLAKLHWKIAYRPTIMENRWSLNATQKFLNGDTVEPNKVYEEIKKGWLAYIEFHDPAFYDFLTLWIIGTYFFHLFNTYPYVYLGGVKRTGKTKALTLASCLAFNAIFSSNVSTASVFRLIQSGRCSLLMDETEKLSNPERAQDFRSLLLTGYKRGGVVYRTEKTTKERHVPEAFEVFSPKMLANIRGIEDVLEDRCISEIMRRGKNRQILNREVEVNDGFWQEIRDHLYVLYLTYWKEVHELYHSFSEVNELNGVCEDTENTLSGREYELWKPLFALAKFFDRYIPVSSQTSETTLSSLILGLAKRKSAEKRAENMTETGDYILVQTLLMLVDENRFYKVKEIRDAMSQHFDEEQKWLNTRWVGRSLKRLGFADKRRVGTGYEYRMAKQIIEDLAERLGIEKPKIEQDEIPEQTKITQTPTVTLTTENFEKVLGAVKTIGNRTVYATLPQLEFSTGISQTNLKEILKVMEKEGKVFQFREGCWKVAK